MIELTGDEIVNTLVMERQVDTRRVIVVEGQEDFQLFELHLEEGVAYLQFAGSKAAVLKAAELCIADSIDWAIFVVDADFDRMTGAFHCYPNNVVASERYDLLMDVVEIDSRLVPQTIIAQAPPNTERQIRQVFNADSIDIALALSIPVGALRYLVVAGEFDLSVRNWSFRGLAKAHLDERLVDSISGHAEERSSERAAAVAVKRRIESLLKSTQLDKRDMVSGHDLAAAIAEIVRFQSGKSIGHDSVCAAIRVALTCEGFWKLSVVQEIAAWARTGGELVFTCQVGAA